MATIDGSWETVTKTPMGTQKAVMKIVSDGDSFTGTNEGKMGVMELENGKIDGDTITWKMEFKAMGLMLEGKATISGDEMTGEVKAGMMGTAPLTGTRIS